MITNEAEFLNHIRGVQGYVVNMKLNEPGFIYDNANEFSQLLANMQLLDIKDPEIIGIMTFLQNEIELDKKRKEYPSRTPQEEAFYRHIVGINSYIRETKQGNPNYTFNNIGEVEGLLLKVQALNTQNPDILAIMDIITKDIRLTYFRLYGTEKALEFQAKLDILGIGVVQEQKER